MYKFPSIEQFRHTIKRVKDKTYFAGLDDDGNVILDYSRDIPTLKFFGTVKLHGTNAAVVYDFETGEIECQSRSRVLTEDSDNAGFWKFANSVDKKKWEQIALNASTTSEMPGKVAIYGEWCGEGIQKGVAITQLPKMFVVFAILLMFEDSSEWVSVRSIPINYTEDRIFNICNFPTYEIDIDFNLPEEAQNKMIDMTMEVEKECPVGKHFGVSGVGEGIVWTCVDPDWKTSDVWFKVKGEKHSTSKVKTLSPVDVEAAKNIASFTDAVVTEGRLEWALNDLLNEQLKPLEMSSMGDFIRTVFNDVVKEESDIIEASGLDKKKIGGPIANKARPWFIKKVNTNVGI